ncbi:MAG: hypothetical protein V3V08_16975 [Nannocystaceae bacterium]
MGILVRAIITGFGLKLGSEIARRISERLSSEDASEENKAKDGESEDVGMPPDLSADGSDA